ERGVGTALPPVGSTRVEYRCMRLDYELGNHYTLMLRLSDARRVIGDGIALARRTGEGLLEQRFLAELVELEMLADDVSASRLPLARAYFGELIHRDRRCATELWGREELAIMLLDREDRAGAREELSRADAVAASCPSATRTIHGVFAKAHVAGDDQVAAVRADIAQLRAAPGTTPGSQAALDQIEGMLLLARDPGAGRA